MAIIYPEIREPFRSIFLSISDGVEEETDQTVYRFALEKEYNSEELKHWLETHEVSGIVSLGSRSLKALTALRSSIPIVVGAVSIKPNGHSLTAISRSPAPQKMFSLLKELKPEVKRIYVVHPMDGNEWLINKARDAAEAEDLELSIQIAGNVHQVAEHYREILKQMKSTDDSLWLPEGGRSLDRALMQKILELSWNRNLTIFSSSFSDVKRGVLFSMYPDNIAMGRRLGTLLQRQLQSPERKPQVLATEDLLTALNIRTAEHLGLHLNRHDIDKFNFVYPSR